MKQFVPALNLSHSFCRADSIDPTAALSDMKGFVGKIRFNNEEQMEVMRDNLFQEAMIHGGTERIKRLFSSALLNIGELSLPRW